MRKWIVEFCIFSLYTVFSMSWFLTSILGPDIATAYELNTQESTLLTNIIYFAKIFGAAFAGFLIYRFGLKRGFIIGCTLISFAVLQGPAEAIFEDLRARYYVLLTLRFFVGLGSATALVCIVPLAQKHFSQMGERVLGSIITLNITSNIIGTLIAAVFAVQLVALFNGRFEEVLVFFGWLNAAIVVLYAVSDSPDSVQEGPKGSKKALYLSFIKNPVVWGMLLYYIGPITFLNFITLHIYFYFDGELAKLLSKEDIGFLSTYSIFAFSIPVVLMPYLAVYFKRYLGHQIALSIIAIGLSAICLAFLAFKDVFGIMALCALAGVVYGGIVPYLLVLPTELKEASEEKSAVINSLFWTGTFVFSFVNSQFLSWIFDEYKSFAYALYFVVFLLLALSLSATWLFLKKELFRARV